MADPPRVSDNVPCFAFFRAFDLLDVLRRTERLFWEESSSDLSGQIRKRGREAECSKRCRASSSDRWDDLEQGIDCLVLIRELARRIPELSKLHIVLGLTCCQPAAL